jgi:hypothetical protein
MADIDPEERESVLADLEDLEAMRALFEPRGYKGVVIVCGECGEDHYYGWDMLRESLEHILEAGEPRMHEPAFEPAPDEYIGWEYGRGYLDAVAEEDAEQTEAPEEDKGEKVRWLSDRARCPYCRARIASRAWDEWGYCPFCGASLSPLRLVDALSARGWTEDDISSLMDECGFEPPLQPGEAADD